PAGTMRATTRPSASSSNATVVHGAAASKRSVARLPAVAPAQPPTTRSASAWPIESELSRVVTVADPTAGPACGDDISVRNALARTATGGSSSLRDRIGSLAVTRHTFHCSGPDASLGQAMTSAVAVGDDEAEISPAGHARQITTAAHPRMLRATSGA